MSLKQNYIPSFLLSEIYSPWKRQPGFIATQVERIASEGFFRSVEIGCFYSREDRQTIRRACAEHDLQVSRWLTEVLDDEGLDISAVDQTLRQHSVERIKAQLPEAAECGATTVALIGGVDPGPSLRDQGYESCYKSLTAICAEAANLGMAVMVEPLDRFAHKKRLVGPTDEAVTLFARVREEYPDFGFAFDTAHAALNEEDIEASLALAREQVVQVHLANAVLEKDDALYGDHHIMPGAPGFLTVRRAAEIIAEAAKLGIKQKEGLRITVEARARETDGEQDTARIATAFLAEAIAAADELVEAA
jgi:hydroxypyruvate isomerase